MQPVRSKIISGCPISGPKVSISVKVSGIQTGNYEYVQVSGMRTGEEEYVQPVRL